MTAHSTSERPATAVLFAMICCIMLASPWPLGSNRDWVWPILAIIPMLVAVTLLLQKRELPGPGSQTFLTLIAVLAGYMALQLTGIPGLVAPQPLDAYSTTTELLKTVGYASFCFALMVLLSDRRRLVILCYLVVITGVLESLLGCVQQLVFDVPRARGSFPNPNHLAGWLEMSICLGIGLMIANRSAEKVGGSALSSFITGPQGRLRLMILIMVVGLIMTHSRSGNIALFSSLIISGLVVVFHTRVVNRYTTWLLLSILVLDTVFIGNYFGLERLQARIQETVSSPVNSEMRIELQRYNLALFRDNPVLGTGPGTYEQAFPPYRDARIPRKPTHAESDYAEFLVELGLLGCMPLVLLLFKGILSQLKLMSRDSDEFNQGIAFGCLAGTVSLLVHGFTDVNLQIPSNTLLFLMLLTIPVVLTDRAARQTSGDLSTPT
ncbi:MAG: O-antigen ligase family protein [Proteobacteria bacterium]|nr:O-antigen ligase family protein [Pseudomonadota bacterium]